jgi:hypothetical protein
MAKIEIANTKRYKKEAEGNLLKWRHNEDRDLKFSEFYHFRGDLIKISTCGGYLVTHRYGEIPFKVGVKMLEFYGKIKDDPDYVPNLKLPISFKGTHYTIDEIHISESVYAESYVIIGCHRFYFDELDRIYNMIFTEKKTN